MAKQLLGRLGVRVKTIGPTMFLIKKHSKTLVVLGSNLERTSVKYMNNVRKSTSDTTSPNDES